MSLYGSVQFKMHNFSYRIICICICMYSQNVARFIYRCKILSRYVTAFQCSYYILWALHFIPVIVYFTYIFQNIIMYLYENIYIYNYYGNTTNLNMYIDIITYFTRNHFVINFMIKYGNNKCPTFHLIQ